MLRLPPSPLAATATQNHPPNMPLTRYSYLKVSDVMTGDNTTYDWERVFEPYLVNAASRNR